VASLIPEAQKNQENRLAQRFIIGGVTSLINMSHSDILLTSGASCQDLSPSPAANFGSGSALSSVQRSGVLSSSCIGLLQLPAANDVQHSRDRGQNRKDSNNESAIATKLSSMGFDMPINIASCSQRGTESQEYPAGLPFCSLGLRQRAALRQSHATYTLAGLTRRLRLDLGSFRKIGSAQIRRVCNSTYNLRTANWVRSLKMRGLSAVRLAKMRETTLGIGFVRQKKKVVGVRSAEMRVTELPIGFVPEKAQLAIGFVSQNRATAVFSAAMLPSRSGASWDVCPCAPPSLSRNDHFDILESTHGEREI
jgi:hypothetical protein